MWNEKSEEEMEVGEEVTIFALDVNISERGFALYSRPSTHIQVCVCYVFLMFLYVLVCLKWEFYLLWYMYITTQGLK